MRALSEQEIRDIAAGAAILASGGGGDPNIGVLAALEAVKLRRSPMLVSFDEIEDDAFLALPWLIGSPVPLIEKFPVGEELVDSLRAFERHMGRNVDAILPAEIGGVNSLIALALASRTGLPVIDADCMGRAYPELHLLTLTLDGISATPLAIVDEHGNVAILECVDNARAEGLARTVAVEFGAIASVTSFPVSGHAARTAAIPGTMSMAERLGRAVRQASAHGEHAVDALCQVGEGVRLFDGKIVDVSRQTADGWAVGEVHLEGAHDDAGRSMIIRFQNENLVAILDGETAATAPDIITIVDADTASAITTEHLKYGFRVLVLGLPSDRRWRTPAGLELGGPRHFGYDVDFVPVEQRFASRIRPGASR